MTSNLNRSPFYCRRSIVLAVWTASAAVVLSATTATSCSCVVATRPRSLLKSGAVLPSNARGIPCADIEGLPRWKFSVKRLDRRAPPVSFKFETIEYPEGYAKKTKSYVEAGLVLLCPEWEPGGVYRVSIAGTSTDVTIASEPFTPDSCGLVVWESEFGSVTSLSLGGSCSVTFPAHRLGVEMLGGVVERWGEALLYLTIVDEEQAWRPSASFCITIPAGQSWVGPMRELLYCECYGDQPTRFGAAEWVLTPGEHDVTMIAWLPGVGHVTATKYVSLGCESGR